MFGNGLDTAVIIDHSKLWQSNVMNEHLWLHMNQGGTWWQHFPVALHISVGVYTTTHRWWQLTTCHWHYEWDWLCTIPITDLCYGFVTQFMCTSLMPTVYKIDHNNHSRHSETATVTRNTVPTMMNLQCGRSASPMDGHFDSTYIYTIFSMVQSPYPIWYFKMIRMIKMATIQPSSHWSTDSDLVFILI